MEAEESNRPLIVGERTNVIGSRLFKNMIAEEKWEEATEIARWQIRNGAHVVDVCLQSTDRDEIERYPAVLRKADPKIKAPIMIDTTDPKRWSCRSPIARARASSTPSISKTAKRSSRGVPPGEGLRRGADGGHHRRRQAAGAGLHAGTQTGSGAAVGGVAHHKIRNPARRHHHRSAGVPLRDRR